MYVWMYKNEKLNDKDRCFYIIFMQKFAASSTGDAHRGSLMVLVISLPCTGSTIELQDPFVICIRRSY